jgi:hypothetical protein
MAHPETTQPRCTTTTVRISGTPQDLVVIYLARRRWGQKVADTWI